MPPITPESTDAEMPDAPMLPQRVVAMDKARTAVEAMRGTYDVIHAAVEAMHAAADTLVVMNKSNGNARKLQAWVDRDRAIAAATGFAAITLHTTSDAVTRPSDTPSEAAAKRRAAKFALATLTDVRRHFDTICAAGHAVEAGCPDAQLLYSTDWNSAQVDPAPEAVNADVTGLAKTVETTDAPRRNRIKIVSRSQNQQQLPTPPTTPTTPTPKRRVRIVSADVHAQSFGELANNVRDLLDATATLLQHTLSRLGTSRAPRAHPVRPYMLVSDLGTLLRRINAIYKQANNCRGVATCVVRRLARAPALPAGSSPGPLRISDAVSAHVHRCDMAAYAAHDTYKATMDDLEQGMYDLAREEELAGVTAARLRDTQRQRAILQRQGVRQSIEQ